MELWCDREQDHFLMISGVYCANVDVCFAIIGNESLTPMADGTPARFSSFNNIATIVWCFYDLVYQFADRPLPTAILFLFIIRCTEWQFRFIWIEE